MRRVGLGVHVGLGLFLGASPFLSAAQAQALSDKAIISMKWAEMPTGNDLGRVYPKKARGQNGAAVMECKVQGNGTLRDCRALGARPAGVGFEEAVVKLAGAFRVAPRPDGGSLVGDDVIIPIHWLPAGNAAPPFNFSVGDMAVAVEPLDARSGPTGASSCPAAMALPDRRCKMQLIVWTSRPGFHQTASTVLGAGREDGISLLVCKTDQGGDLTACQAEGARGDLETKAMLDLSRLLHGPKVKDSNQAPPAGATVVVGFDWEAMTQAIHASTR